MVEPVLINLNDKERGFHFNNYALQALGNALQVDPVQASDKLMTLALTDAIGAIAFVLYSGFVGYEKAQGNFFNLPTFPEIAKEMATCNQNDFSIAYEQFKQAIGMADFLKNLPEPEPSDEKKNKSRSRKSSSTPSVS